MGYMLDYWNLGCFGKFYPQKLWFNVTEKPGFFHGYVPDCKVPFLPKDCFRGTVFPNTVVDFQPGPEGWSLEFQCVELLGGIRFVGINFYAKQRSIKAYNEMLASLYATG